MYPYTFFFVRRVEVIRPAAENDGADVQLSGFTGFQVFIHVHDFRYHLLRIKRFHEIIFGPDLHGFHRGFHGGIGGHHQHAQIRRHFPGLFQQFDPIHTGHFDVGEHQVVGCLGQFFQCRRPGFSGIHRKVFVLQPCLQGIADDLFVIDHQDAKLFAPVRLQPDGVRRADAFTFTAVRTGRKVDDIGVGNGMGNGKVDGLSGAQPLIEGIRDVNRANFLAHTAPDTEPGVHPGRLFSEGHGEIAGFTVHLGDIRIQEDVDVFVEKALAQTELGSVVALDQGQHLTHTAVVCRELNIELAQDSADMGGVIDERHPVSGLRQIQGGTNPADTRSNDKSSTDFSVHDRSSYSGLALIYISC